MSVLDQKSVYTSLQQNGPLAVTDTIIMQSCFSKESRVWLKVLCQSPLNMTRYRALRNQVFEFLGISDFSEITTLIQNQEKRKQRSKRACTLLGNMFGILGTPEEVERSVQEYARTADAVINSLKSKILAPYASHIAITNEIEITSDPVDLLLMMFDDKYHKKARFEARRKLVLMNLAASIDQRERETEIEKKFSDFLNFLNDYVWSKNLKIGEHDIVYLLSKHDKKDFSCSEVTIIDRHEASNIKKTAGTKLTLLKRRQFSAGKEETPIFVSIRKKPPEAKVLKLLRKNEKNPAIAVDDELGLMAVLNSVSDVKVFQKHLTKSAAKADSFMVLEDMSDTLSAGSYSSTSVGSSNKTAMLKFFARLGGMRVEFIIHTNKSWLDYMYQQDVAHDEYEVKRLFDSGVAELLFPNDIFHMDFKIIREDMIRQFRRQIEQSI